MRTSSAFSHRQPTMLPPGMKRLAQTMLQPPSACATMRVRCSAGVEIVVGRAARRPMAARPAAKPAMHRALGAAACGLRTKSTARSPSAASGYAARIAGNVSSTSGGS